VVQPDFENVKSHVVEFIPHRPIKHPHIALVLSGGGARGISAIGVLRVLERHHIPIDLIVGTSIGSVVGGLYACGYSVDQLQQIADTTAWNEIMSFNNEARRRDMFLDQKLANDKSILVLRFEGFEPVIPQAFSSGQRLTNDLNLLLLQGIYHPNPSFDDLRIPFRAVSTDLVTGKRIVSDHGDLTMALRASMSIPLLFNPVQRDTMQLLDGGLLDNLPVDVALENHADVVVAVDVMSPLHPRDQLNTPWVMADQITTIMMQEANKRAREKADVVIMPNLGNHSSSDFTQLDSLVRLGEEAAEAALPQLQQVLDKRWHSVQRVEHDIVYRLPKFSWNSIPSTRFSDSTVVWEQRGWNSAREIQWLVNQVYYEGRYASVQAVIKNYGDSTHIEIQLAENTVLRSVRFTGNHFLTTDTLASVFRSLVGHSINIDTATHAMESLLRLYRNAGYSLARICNVQYDSTSQIASIKIDEGIIHRYEVKGTEKTRDWIIWRELPFHGGDVFQISQVAQGIRNVYGTGLFEQILVTVHHEGSDDERNVVTINAHERRTELIRFGLRIDNERGIQPSVDIRDENFVGVGVEMGLSIGGGSRNQSIIGEVKATRIFNSYMTFGIKGYSISRDVDVYQNAVETDPDLFDRQEIGEYKDVCDGGTVGVGMQLGRLGTATIDGRLEWHHLYNTVSTPIANQSYGISSIRLNTNIDTQDKVPFPTDGTVVNFSYESALMNIDNAIGFTKMYFSYDRYVSFLERYTIHPHFSIGLADKDLPLSEEFSLGGQNNFYGFRDDNARGRQLFLASLEYQYRLPWKLFFDTYIKARYDLGAVWEQPEEISLNAFTHGVGLAVGFDTPIGPAEFAVGEAFYLRTDLFNHPVSYGPFMAYFSIGFPITGVVHQ
ncbi:MAG TPA: patatin-like phospholipase family protein, partial [Bacteroidota bacterium]|nr:patatin-like phospholipase family protein [Bacteroidota bacterium]